MEIGDFPLRQPAAGRHRLDPVGMPDRAEEQAIVRLSRVDQRNAGGPAFAKRIRGIEPQARLLLVGSVTLETAFDQQRADARLEEAVVVSGGRGLGGPKEPRRQRERSGEKR
jgi:hypothetical protein